VTSLGWRDSARIRRAAERITELDWSETVQVAGQRRGVQDHFPAARHFSGRSAFNRFETLWRRSCCAGAAPEARTHRLLWRGFGWWKACGDWRGVWTVRPDPAEIGAYNQLWKAIHMGRMERRRRSRIWAARDADADPLGLFNLALHGGDGRSSGCCSLQTPTA